MSGKKNDVRASILVVDDSKVSRVLLKKIFGELYDVSEAEDGNYALEFLRKQSVDAVILDLSMPLIDGFEVLAQMRADKRMSKIPVIVVTASSDEESQMRALSAGAIDVLTKPFSQQLLLHRVHNIITQIEAAKTAERAKKIEKALLLADTDEVTGLFNKNAFIRRANEIMTMAPNRKYVLMRWDLDNFKIFNDRFGRVAGDAYLRSVGDYYKNNSKLFPELLLVGRFDADHFVLLWENDGQNELKYTMATDFIRKATKKGSFTYIPSIGLFRVDDPYLDVSLMCDRALLALRYMKGKYNCTYAWYEDSMRDALVRQHTIIDSMSNALASGQFCVYYQPQYNHETGKLTGAEALVRWMKPDGEIISPNDFIPLFEKNGFIFELDKYIWEQVCAFLARRLDDSEETVSVSVNVSRYDIINEAFFDTLCELVKKYDIPAELLRIEITESAFTNDTEQMIATVKQLKAFGFTVEIDDFGSGYSSFNTLKDVPADILKLDMRFLQSTSEVQRSGNILESIVRMSKWLGMSVIAEGVENKNQADFLKSIGCFYVQGFLYAKPMPQERFEELLSGSELDRRGKSFETVEGMNGNAFWSADSIDTLIFSSYVGAACVAEYTDGRLEIIRVNDRFREALHTQHSSEILMNVDMFNFLSEANQKAVLKSIDACKDVGDEISGVVCADFRSDHVPHTEYLRYYARAIAKAGNRIILYAIVENITEQYTAEENERDTSAQNRFLNEVASDLLSMNDVELVIDSVLNKILEYFDGERAYIFEFDNDKQLANNTYEVCKQGVVPAKELLQDVDFSVFSFWFEAFSRSNYLAISVNDIGDGREAEKKLLVMQDIDSLVATPLHRDGVIIGILGVDNPRKNYKRMDSLLALGDYIAIMLTRRDMNSKLQANHEQLIDMMNDTPGGFVRMRINADGSIVPVFMNKNFCDMFGLTYDEAMKLYGEDAYAGVHPDDLLVTQTILASAIENNSVENLRVRLIRKDGSYITVQAYYRMTRDGVGTRYINGYYADITSSISYEQRIHDIIDNLPAGIGVYEHKGDGTFMPQYLSDKVYELFGYTRAEHDELAARGMSLFSKNIDELMTPEEVERFMKGERIEFPCLSAERKDGSIFYMRAIIQYTKGIDSLYNMYVTIADVTDSVVAERERLRNRLELAMREHYEYICLIHTDTGEYEVYDNVNISMSDVPKFEHFDKATDYICKTFIADEDKEEYRKHANIADIVRAMNECEGHYSYTYRMPDGLREAIFFRIEPTHTQVFMAVRKLEQ